MEDKTIMDQKILKSQTKVADNPSKYFIFGSHKY